MTLQQSFAFEARPSKAARRNLVIEAGAGTGKTTAIVAEVVQLMLDRNDLDPARIVLMTFTEKAAGEIADRIREALEELLAALSLEDEPGVAPPSWPAGSPHPLVTITDLERARATIARHLASIDTLRSQTIHSFCQSLLRSFPIEAGLDPQFKIIEGFERSLLYGQVYDSWLDHETRVAPDPAAVQQWELLFAHVGYLFQIREVVLALFERRDLLGETGYDFGDLATDCLPTLEAAVVWIRRDSATCKDAPSARVAAYLRATPLPEPMLEAWIDYLEPIAPSLRQIDLRYCGALKEPMVVLRSGDKGDSIYDRLVSHRAAMALLALTRRFLDFLDAEKRTLGVVDFDDLLLRTLTLLNDETVLARARTQFDYIFVDEFQDTDRTQARIIDKLARDEHGQFVAGKTIVVGDPKQSIYGFRRADPETYYRMTEELVRGGAERRVLEDQYRSDPPLLSSINAMFSRLFPLLAHDPNVFRPAYHPLQARARGNRGRHPSSDDTRITILDARHDEKSDRFFAEGEAIAEWIGAHRTGEAFDLQRFAILFRRLTKIDDYLDTLDRYGIPYVLPPTRLFLDRRAPVDLVAVLRAIAYPFDLGAQISAARTPYFALTDVEIASGLTDNAGDEAASWNAFKTSIAALEEASRHLTVSQLIDFVITTCAIEPVYESATDGVRHLRHLEHVRSIAFAYDQRLGGSVRQFVDEIARRRADPEEMEPSLADDTQNAVRILSVHTAKGLEFDTVILPDLSFPTNSSDAMQLFTVEEPRSIVLSGRAESLSANFRFTGDEKLKKVGSRREEAEMRRLFYVAVTRARTDVVFVCNLHDETRNMGFLKSLNDALGTDKASLAELWEPGEQASRRLRQTAIGPVAFERMEVQGTAAPTRPRLRNAELQGDLAAAPIVALTLPDSVAVAETLGAAEVAARRAGSRNRTAGILLHRTLELWDGDGELEPLLQQLGVESGADSETITRVRRRMTTMARSPMWQRIRRAQTAGREVVLHFVENGVATERRLDRILRETVDGAPHDLIIDYKSGAPDPDRIPRDRQQIERYCRALSAMTGHPCTGALWYIDLERDEVVEVVGSL